MVIFTYVDDCINALRSMKDGDSFVYSMYHGSEIFILTDEVDVNKFLGIEITHDEDSSFELYQPFYLPYTFPPWSSQLKVRHYHHYSC